MSPIKDVNTHNKKTKKTKASRKTIRPSRIVITAGPTIEPIDPVRFISNRSTGYMGYALAEAARKRRYKVILISGPTSIKPPRGVRFISIQTTRELYKRTLEEFKKADILIMASAVADFKPAFTSKNKIKAQKAITLELIRTPDVLRALSRRKTKRQILVGFSLETENLLENARRKLKEKKVDFIIANKTSSRKSAFGAGAKDVYILGRNGLKKSLKNVTKEKLACTILDTVEELCYTPD